MVLDSFMESYGRNVIIKGSASDMTAFFEGVTPCNYEDAIESFFEAQYSIEAMSVMTANAIMMESAGVDGVVSEGVVGDFFKAAVEKIKETASKVKQFAVAIIKKIVDFFHQLYMKNSPIDKVMQTYGKNAVSHADIVAAVSNGYKIPGNLKVLTKDTNGVLEDILKKFATVESTITIGSVNMQAASDENTNGMISTFKNNLEKVRETDKEMFTWVGQILSENDEYSKKNQLKQFVRKANDGSDKSAAGHIEDDEWKLIVDYALNGQSKIKNYKDEVQTKAKEAVAVIEKTAELVEKGVKSIQDAKTKQDSANASEAARINANASKIATAYVTYSSYVASRSVNIMQRVILPVMKKMHNSAISTFISVNSAVKAKNKKALKGK